MSISYTRRHRQLRSECSPVFVLGLSLSVPNRGMPRVATELAVAPVAIEHHRGSITLAKTTWGNDMNCFALPKPQL